MSTSQNSASNAGCGCAKPGTETQPQNPADTAGHSTPNLHAASSSEGGPESAEGTSSTRDQVASSFDGESAYFSSMSKTSSRKR